MKQFLSKQSYKGVDGTSLSEPRCLQVVQVYEMLEQLGCQNMTYMDLQNKADEVKLFGKTNAKSAIRTIFPLLKKIGFVVDYDCEFTTDRLFTDLGKLFVLACRALKSLTPEIPNVEEVKAKLINIKQNLQKIGLINLLSNPENKNHNIRIALRLLKELKIINWNEFLYVLFSLENNHTIEFAIDNIHVNRKQIDSIEFVNEKGEVLPTTCYTYLRSYLEEAGLIKNINSKESELLKSATKFFSQISI